VKCCRRGALGEGEGAGEGVGLLPPSIHIFIK
jgi:hypothetical protein